MTRYAEVPLPSLPVRKTVVPAPMPSSASTEGVDIVVHGPGVEADVSDRALALCRVAGPAHAAPDVPVLLPADMYAAPPGRDWALDVRGLELQGQLAAAVASAVHLGVREIHTYDPATVARAAVTARAILAARRTGTVGDAGS